MKYMICMGSLSIKDHRGLLAITMLIAEASKVKTAGINVTTNLFQELMALMER